MYDILIKGGTIIDGTGAERFRADVAIQGEYIVEIGNLADSAAHTIVDATDKFVTPGFIDVNNHSDAYWKLFSNPSLDSLVYQGVTTIIGGNSGSSLAPLIEPDMIKSIQKWTDVSRVNIDWQNMGEFFDAVYRRNLSINFGSLVGHATLRRAMLHDEIRELTEKELDMIAQVLDESLRMGALGLSTALMYAHGRTTTHDELLTLAKVVQKHDAILVAYLSDEKDGILDSLREKIAIARETGVRLHISHLKAIGQDNWSLMDDALEMIEDARKDKLDITVDVYPYTTMSAVLYTLLPNWVTDGGRIMMLRRLKDKSTRARVEEEMQNQRLIDLGDAIVSISPLVKELSHRRIADIASAREQSIVSTIIDLLLASNGHVIVLLDVLSEDGLRNAMRHPFTMVASNGGGYSEQDWQTGELIHPRSFGTFSRFLKYYVHEQDVVTWEDAISRITALPAQQYGIDQRGVLSNGRYADIAVFNPNSLSDQSSFQQPYHYSQGMHAVIVNGQVVFANDHVMDFAGQVV